MVRMMHRWIYSGCDAEIMDSCCVWITGESMRSANIMVKEDGSIS